MHNGKLKPTDLDTDLIQKTYDQLNKAAAEGYGANYTQFKPENSKTVQQLKQNIYQFSAAKTFQQLQHYNNLLIDENGKERDWNSFKKLVLEVHPKYNKNYLQAEYQTAKASAQMARKWEGFQRNKERYPYLKYKTVGDDHVRDDHQKLANFTAHIDDPIWDKIYPPNGWRCRCYIVQTNQASNEAVPDTSFIDPEFNINVGKTGVIFTPEHPYFVFPKKDEKSFKKAFESFKLIAPYGKAEYVAKNGAKVFVNPFADAYDLKQNFSISKVLADQLKTNVKIRPHANIDGLTNTEFEVFKTLADAKAVKNYSGIKNGIKATNKQGAGIAILDLNNIKNIDINIIYRNLKGNITEDINKTVKSVILLRGEKAILIKREAILKDQFLESIKKLKS